LTLSLSLSLSLSYKGRKSSKLPFLPLCPCNPFSGERSAQMKTKVKAEGFYPCSYFFIGKTPFNKAFSYINRRKEREKMYA
jgi:hypothetical protein